MEHIGLNPQRLRIELMSSGEGLLFTEVMNDFSRRVKALGALGTSEGMDKKDLSFKLDAVTKLTPYIKLATREKLALHLDKAEDYNELFNDEEIDRLFREVPCYHIDAETCRACMICLRKCPAAAIAGGKKRIHVIDQEKCIKCGTCFEACPPRFGAIRKVCGEPFPGPGRQEERAAISKSEAE
jgi:ferredoxin